MNFFAKIKDFLKENEQKIVVIIGFLLILAISFEFGVLQGQKWQQKPLIIEKPVVTPQQGDVGQSEASSGLESKNNSALPAKSSANHANAIPAKMNACAYVGSKSSDKFYLPSCSYAKRIKPENVVCFKSKEEALGQGRKESVCK